MSEASIVTLEGFVRVIPIRPSYKDSKLPFAELRFHKIRDRSALYTASGSASMTSLLYLSWIPDQLEGSPFRVQTEAH